MQTQMKGSYVYSKNDQMLKIQLTNANAVNMIKTVHATNADAAKSCIFGVPMQMRLAATCIESSKCMKCT